MKIRQTRILVTCEHASNRVPEMCATVLEQFVRQAEQHQIYDWGAPSIARALENRLQVPLLEGVITRLAIDLNRSVSSAELFSAPIVQASEVLKARLIAEYFLPFRSQAEDIIRGWIEDSHAVLHLSIHSFTPIYQGRSREIDFGVLYDQSRPQEVVVANALLEFHKRYHADLRVAANQPYQGTDDGHVTALRKRFGSSYAGIEVEYSQGLDLDAHADRWANGLHNALASLASD